jgi:soluble lytic murein transglycosylase-like protein
MHRTLILSGMLAAAQGAAATTECWSQAAQQYGVSAELLYAVARAESDLNPSAVNLSHKARTGTYDIGLMQINSSHLPRLARAGISEKDLYDPCTNIRVGAWLMAHSFARHGVSWNAVGAYNAACSQLKGEACSEARSKYAWRVYRRLPSQPPAAQRANTRGSASPQPVFILSAKVSP